jgi:hypothetical protein
MKKIGGNDMDSKQNLSKIHEINAGNIDTGMYFLSLTDNAMNAGLLSETDTDYMQTLIYDILSDSVWMNTNGTSVSVTSQEANELMLSVLYALDCYCISQTSSVITDSDIHIHKLKTLIETFRQRGEIRNCYHKGLEFIDKTLAEVKILAKEIYINRIHTKSELYNLTLNRSIFVFIENYKHFSAHRIDADIDYPAAVKIKKCKGINYVKKYLEYINLETAFYNKCSEFYGEPEIKKLIRTYAANNLTNEEGLMDNIFGIIFANVFFLFLAKIKDKRLIVTQEEFKKLSESLYNTTSPDLLKLINKTTVSLFITLKVTGGLKNYVSEYIKIFVRYFMRSVKSRRLHHTITVDAINSADAAGRRDMIELELETDFIENDM